MNTTRCICIFLAFVLSCGASGQREVEYAAVGVGRAARVVEARGGWQVTLEEARVALGPVYFCATQAASADLCPSARAELLATWPWDALDPRSQHLGTVHGVTGSIGSAQYDFGIVWLETDTQPRALQGAVDGHSAVFRGRATRGDRTLRFVANIDAIPRAQGTHVVQGARTSADVLDSHTRLEVTVDPNLWWSGVDFDEFVDAPADDVVVVPADSRAANAVLVAMTANATPQFRWVAP
ncbi:MAG: hypothetical protein AB2A00_10545 [Myxococcota bacterium]